MPVLTLVDVLQIQRYIFASNRLRDIVAGSEIVGEACRKCTLESCFGGAPGRVVQSAGGGAVLWFPDVPAARELAGRWSRWLLDKAPGLEAEVVHHEYRDGEWGRACLDAATRMSAAKRGRIGHASVRGLSVTAECRETRHVATHRQRAEGGGEHALSAGILRRREVRARLGAGTPIEWNEWRLYEPFEIDDLGRSKGDTSLIGVVHVDGNAMGSKLRGWLKRRCGNGRADAELQRDQADLSKAVNGAFEEAWKRARERVVRRLSEVDDEVVLWSGIQGSGFELRPMPEGQARLGRRALFLPFRLVYQGGDDLTFLCDARIALDLARAVLESLRDQRIRDFADQGIGACAGVAIVKSHSPFARAHALAEALCRGAKEHLLEREDHQHAIDWQVGLSSPLETLSDLRTRTLQVPSAQGPLRLTKRPYVLGDPGTPDTFAWLDEVLLGPSGFHGEAWSRHRNKAKELRELVREGPEAVTRALAAWKVTADIHGLPPQLGPGGFHGISTAILDALELLDLHLSLRDAPSARSAQAEEIQHG